VLGVPLKFINSVTVRACASLCFSAADLVSRTFQQFPLTQIEQLDSGQECPLPLAVVKSHPSFVTGEF